MFSSTSDAFAARRSERKPFHILTTKFLEDNEVLVHFSDGTAAIFEAEELEKLRNYVTAYLAKHTHETE